MFLFFCNIYLGGRIKMIKIAKELNKVIESLEDSGKYVEAKELHNVFIKVAQFEFMMPGVAMGQAVGNAVGNALAPAAQGLVSNAIGGIQNAIGGVQNAFGGAVQGAAKGVGNVMNSVGSYGASLQGKNNANVSANYQALIEEYKNRFVNELKSTNNSYAPATSQFFNSVMQGNMLTEFEKQAFRAQAYRIRTEVRNQMYGMGDTSKIGNQGNINLLVENVVKVSGLYNERNFANLDRYFPLIMSSIEQQISQRINQNERTKYLQSAKALVGTYINRQKAVLQNSAMQPR